MCSVSPQSGRPNLLFRATGRAAFSLCCIWVSSVNSTPFLWKTPRQHTLAVLQLVRRPIRRVKLISTVASLSLKSRYLPRISGYSNASAAWPLGAIKSASAGAGDRSSSIRLRGAMLWARRCLSKHADGFLNTHFGAKEKLKSSLFGRSRGE